MDEQPAELFRGHAIKSKAELLRAIDDFKIALDGESWLADIPAARRSIMAQMLDEFRAKVEDSDLAFLGNPFDRYEILVTGLGISLEIATCTDVKFDEKGELREAMIESVPDVLSVRAPFIPLKDFAKMNDVKAATVSRWIRNGHLKNVERREEGWFVAPLQEKLDEAFCNGMFVCEREDDDLSSIAPVKPGTHSLDVINYGDGDIELTSFDNETRAIGRQRVGKDSYRKIERALLEAEGVVFVGTFSCAIDEKAPLMLGGGQAQEVSMEQVEGALAKLDLTDSTRMHFDLIIHSLHSEELLLEAISALGLEGEILSNLS